MLDLIEKDIVSIHLDSRRKQLEFYANRQT